MDHFTNWYSPRHSQIPDTWAKLMQSVQTYRPVRTRPLLRIGSLQMQQMQQMQSADGATSPTFVESLVALTPLVQNASKGGLGVMTAAIVMADEEYTENLQVTICW
jgi:hypothetical protein